MPGAIWPLLIIALGLLLVIISRRKHGNNGDQAADVIDLAEDKSVIKERQTALYVIALLNLITVVFNIIHMYYSQILSTFNTESVLYKSIPLTLLCIFVIAISIIYALKKTSDIQLVVFFNILSATLCLFEGCGYINLEIAASTAVDLATVVSIFFLIKPSSRVSIGAGVCILAVLLLSSILEMFDFIPFFFYKYIMLAGLLAGIILLILQSRDSISGKYLIICSIILSLALIPINILFSLYVPLIIFGCILIIIVINQIRRQKLFHSTVLLTLSLSIIVSFTLITAISFISPNLLLVRQPSSGSIGTIKNLPSEIPDGNAQSNLINGGHVAESEGWVYFASSQGMAKMKPDGSEVIRLSADYCDGITVVDGWVYYRKLYGYRGYLYSYDYGSIYRMRTDGSEETLLVAGSTKSRIGIPIVSDGWICYNVWSDGDGNRLMRIRTDGSGQSQIFDNYNELHGFVDGWIYYNRLSRMHTDGSNAEQISEYIGDFIFYVDQTSVFYRKDGFLGMSNLYKTNHDGSSKTDLPALGVYRIGGIGDLLYYTTSSRLFEMRIDGSLKRFICDDYYGIECIYIAGGNLYLMGHNGALMRIDPKSNSLTELIIPK